MVKTKKSMSDFCKTCDLHPKKIPFEYSQINNYIHIGSNMCCQGHFKKSLLKKGIKADLSLEDSKLDAPWGVDAFLWLPTKDHRPPTKAQVKLGVDFIKSCVQQKKKVYVHCQRGHTRAPTMVIAYFISEGMSLEKAFEKVKKKRSVMHLGKKQISFLKRIEKNGI